MTERNDAPPEPTAYPFSEPDQLSLDPRYTAAQSTAGLTRVQLPYGTPAWLVTRYEDVRAMLADTRFSREAACGEDEPRVISYVHRPDTLTTMDPPRHTRLRRVVAKAFTARRIETMRASTEAIVAELLDEMTEQEPPVDLMRSIGLSVPMLVICELLGVPHQDHHRFHEWSAILASTASSGIGTERLQQVNGELRAYLAKLLAHRREEPADDLLTVLAEAPETDDRLSEDEMVSLAWSVLLAGYEITAYQIGNFVYTLLTEPSLFADLRERPDRVDTAVEELLRYIPLTSAAFYARRATEDVELGGTLVRRGEAVLASMTAANRDVNAFPSPDRIDLTRPDNPHLAFSYGIHHCLGAQLARMELRAVLSALVTRVPSLRLAVLPEKIQWRQGSILRGPLQLMVAW